MLSRTQTKEMEREREREGELGLGHTLAPGAIALRAVGGEGGASPAAWGGGGGLLSQQRLGLHKRKAGSIPSNYPRANCSVGWDLPPGH